ncbi:universal stress protein [Desulfosediminicola ganghwensis]|uniref:universal stress protein n=1 Tax=Desulfosediminicola ganghwensis TaxID=2569540 RepID=UPI0010AC6DBF|nr:universal stress protein [Desulfosediminicola ganghwensis]
MKEIKHIIVPVDLVEHTRNIVDLAIFMANRHESEICFFHCVEFVESASMWEMAIMKFSYEDYMAKKILHAEQAIQNFIKDAASECQNYQISVVAGDIVSEIMACAETNKGDLIIMGTHGKQTQKKIVLGSISEQVLRKAQCPVMVINP